MSINRHRNICKPEISRRDFLKYSGTAIVGLGVSGCAPLFRTKDGKTAMPVSGGYLLVDTKKCQGCLSCMLACTLAHEGNVNPSLARIQIIQDPFEKWPDDLSIEQCRQCVDALCVKACQYDALKPNPKFGNVRMVDRNNCVGCYACVEACPYTPSRPAVAEDEKYEGEKKSRKCDLCADTPFWKQKGCVKGKQACIEVCPVSAISFTSEIPEQSGDSGYKVNLRGEAWAKLGYPND